MALLLVFAGGWIAAGAFQSPAQRAARAQAPPPESITAEVTQGTLAETINVEATIVRARQQAVPLGASGTPAVVTKQTKTLGSSISALEPIAEINGRPVFAVPGQFPFYRDLSLGDSGPDVTQLQAALRAGGYKITVDGNLGASTESALRNVYRSSGYSPNVASSTDSSGNAPADQPSSSEATPPLNATSGKTPPTVSTLTVPSEELAVFTELPATLLSSPPIGSTIATGTAITVESGPVVATATVTAAIALRLQPGMSGELTLDDGTPIQVAVDAIEDAPKVADSAADSTAETNVSDSGDGSSTLRFAVPDGSELTDSALHSKATIRITVRVAADNSLLVPSLAIVSGGSGKSWILKREPDGSFAKVAVKETGQLSGQSAVTPLISSELSAHDRVKVG